MNTLSESVIAKLKTLAKSHNWSDYEDFRDTEDAYYGGVPFGQMLVARMVLDDVGIKWSQK